MELSWQARVEPLLRDLKALPGLAALALGGSRASGRARPDSDVDLGLYYDPDRPFGLADLRAVCARHHAGGAPEVTDFYAWGPWVNGGAWLAVRGQRVDLIYRSLPHLERVIADAEAGRHELHAGQQPPYGYFSTAYLGELQVAKPLHDPEGHLARLQRRSARYPEPLRAAIVGDYLWQVQFALRGVAPGYLSRGDPFAVTGLLARACHHLLLALFALNRRYWLSDKTALDDADRFPDAPRDLARRVRAVLARPGDDEAALRASVRQVEALLDEAVALAGPLYTEKFQLARLGRG